MLAFSLSLLSTVLARAEPLVIAWAELESGDLADGYRNAATLVPRQLMSEMGFVGVRYPGDDEVSSVELKRSAEAMESARKAVADARAKRDLAALSVRDPGKRAADIVAADAAVEKARAHLDELISAEALAGTEPPEPNGAPVSYELRRWAEHDSGSLFPVAPDPAAACAEKKVDVLVHGRLDSKGDYLVVELSVFVASLGRDIWTGTEYAYADGLQDLVGALVRPAAEAALGRPYSRVAFRIDPPQADLYVDGKRVLDSDVLYFEPGEHEAQARAGGWARSGAFFVVVPGEDAFVSLSLEEETVPGFTLRSLPSGASVYLDGSLAGVSPFEMPGFAYPRVARITMPGYDDAQLVVRPELLMEDTEIALLPSDGLSFDDRFDDRKGAFYRSLGLFVVSLPVTVLSGGLFQTFYATLVEAQKKQAEGDTSIETAIERLNSEYYTTQTVFWVSAAASAGFAANAIIQLVRYIGASQ